MASTSRDSAHIEADSSAALRSHMGKRAMTVFCFTNWRFPREYIVDIESLS